MSFVMILSLHLGDDNRLGEKIGSRGEVLRSASYPIFFFFPPRFQHEDK